MKIKIKKDCKIPEKSGWCFRKSGYDEELIKQINTGETVEVDKIHPDARELVNKVKTTKSESK